MGKHECPDDRGQCHFWELRLLVEKVEARDHSVKSLKGWSGEFVYNSLNNENPIFSLIFGIYMNFLIINLSTYRILVRPLLTTVLEDWYFSKRLHKIGVLEWCLMI